MKFQVIIFLTNTLKKGIFQRILRENQVAASHYVQYLYSKQYIEELVDTLEYVLCLFIANNKINKY